MLAACVGGFAACGGGGESDGGSGNGGAGEGSALSAQDAAADAPAMPAAPAAPAAPGPVTFTDSRGVAVTVENPQRVVACMGSFAHIWELAGGTLVGVSDDAIGGAYTLVSTDAATMGDFSAPNLEAIIDLDPDFVIMTTGTGGRGGGSSQVELAGSLAEAGITVATFNVTTFEDYLDMLAICTQITGNADAYQRYGQDVADRIDAIKASVPAREGAGEGAGEGESEGPVVLVGITFSGGMRVQAGSTMPGGMVVELGGTNLADVNPSLLTDYSMEAVIEADPDVILLIAMGNTDDAAATHLAEMTAANPAWANLTAVQNGKYLALDPSLFMYKPCENWADAYQAIYDALYK